MRIRRVLVPAAFMVFFVLVMAMNASATTLVATLDQGNSDLADYDGPFANVYIDLTSYTTATVRFVALGDYLLGDGNIVGVNVNATTFIYSQPEEFAENGTPGWTGGNGSTAIVGASTGGVNVSDFGSYDLVYKSHDGLSSAVTSLTFQLTNTSGTWDSPSNVLEWNNGGGAVGHIFTTSGISGFAGGSPVVPIPSTLLLLGSGLVGLVGIGRWRKRK